MDAPDERLESWKKIAAYLRRDVRTVQRWEQSHGLPIHRLTRAQRPIPYAYKKELDAWWASQSELATSAEPPPPARRRFVVVAALIVVIVAGAGSYVWLRDPPVPPRSVAVLPFVDLSEGMPNEEFADGVTEEIIDQLNRRSGMRAPAPTSTFFYKNKQVPVAEIARALDVAYVLDGSVRKSGERLRVAARLIRATDNAVVWSETFEEPWSSILQMQDDISGFVTGGIDRTFQSARSP